MPTTTSVESPRAERFRKLLATVFTTAVWGGVAVAAYLRRRDWRVLTRSAEPRGSRLYQLQQERWSNTYPTAEDYTGEETQLFVDAELGGPPIPPEQHQPHG
jgi:hypothetical protein